MVSLLKIVCLIPLVPGVLAVPYKRYDNGTDFESYNSTSTSTVFDYTTIVLPSTTLVMPTSATRELSILSGYMNYEGISTVTDVVTSYQTLTSDGITSAVPYTVTTEKVVAKESSDACSPQTVTKTETETETETVTGGADADGTEEDTYSTVFLTSTLTTSFPVEAEFTYSDLTTTMTSFVQVTSTITSASETHIPGSSSAVASSFPSVAPGFNGTYSNSTEY